MAGANGGFDAAGFRSGIRFAMAMGAPPATEEQVYFYMPLTVLYSRGLGDDDLPFDPSATRTSPQGEQIAPIQVPCAVSFVTAAEIQTNFGEMDPGDVAVTLLDQDYGKVKGCQYITLRGQRYLYQSTEPPVGLFNVGVYTLLFKAESIT